MIGALLVGALSSQPGWGCVLPPDLKPEGPDAGPSSPPVIMSASPADFAFPGPINIDRAGAQDITLDVEDNDLGDSIYVKLYRDYNREPVNQPTPALVDCGSPGPSTTKDRSIKCSTNSLCIGIEEGDQRLRVLEVMVADRPFIDDSDPEAVGQPQYRALQDKGSAAFSFRDWSMRCGTPQ